MSVIVVGVVVALHIYPPITGHLDSIGRQLWGDPHAFHCDKPFEFGGICSCLRISSDPMFL